MHDTFEFRDDFARSQGAAGAPVMLCPVKWGAVKIALAALRKVASERRHLPVDVAVAVLDQSGLTPDFEPSKVEVGIETARAPVFYP